MSSNPRTGPIPLVRCEAHGRVDQTEIEDQPDDEAGRLEQRLAHVQGIHDFPRDVQGEAEEGHAVGFGLETAQGHEDVGRVPEQDAEPQQHGRERDDPARDMVGGNVAGAHLRRPEREEPRGGGRGFVEQRGYL